MNTAAEARDIVFGDVLACDEMRPAAFLPGSVAPAASGAHGEALLRALAVIEDGARAEAYPNAEPEQPADHAMHRMEAKLDLLTLLVAGISARDDADPPRPLRWSARGACIAVDGPLAPGSGGLFRVRPGDWLPTPLLLPSTVVACDTDERGAARAWLRFDPMPAALQAALERHLFRIHRRSIAESRRLR